MRRAFSNRSAGGVAGPSPATTRLWNRIIAAWVWATTRFSSLRWSGIAALRASEADPLPTRGTSKPTRAWSPPIFVVLPTLRRVWSVS